MVSDFEGTALRYLYVDMDMEISKNCGVDCLS